MKKFFAIILTFALALSCVQIPAQAAWQQKGNSWYYTGSNGKPVTGWLKVGYTWYFFNGKGVMQTGWQQIGGKWYYMNSSGAMVTGWQQIGGKWYYMNGSGAMVTGWQQIGGKWYYMNGSGAMVTGWQYIGGKWYYMNSSGAMVTGWVSVGKDLYYFYDSGAMAVNTFIDGVAVGKNGKAVQAEMVQRYGNYIGQWSSTKEYHFMDIFIESGIMYLEYSCFTGNASRIATAFCSITLSDIENDQATFFYSYDGWGNEGTLVLDFSQTDQISCTATVTYTDPSANWSIVDGSRTFIQ